LCGVTVYDLYAITTLTMRAPRLRIYFCMPGAKRFGSLLLISALVLNWIYLLTHWRNF
jgi:hypothetical protein